MVRAADHAVNARDLPGRLAATTRPGGQPEVVTQLWESPGRDGPHEDTAQCSAYEVIAGRSISAGDDSASVSPAHGSLSSAGRVAGSPSCTPGRLEQPTITRHVRYART